MTLIDRVYPIPVMLFAFYREAMLLLLLFYSWLFYKDMVEWIDEDAKLVLNHANGETYSSFNQL